MTNFSDLGYQTAKQSTQTQHSSFLLPAGLEGGALSEFLLGALTYARENGLGLIAIQGRGRTAVGMFANELIQGGNLLDARHLYTLLA